MRTLAIALLGTLALVGCGTQEEDVVAKAMSAAKVSLADAVKAAKQAAGGGSPIEIEMGFDDNGTPIYEIEVANGAEVTGVVINALDGSAAKTEKVVLNDAEALTLEAFLKVDKEQRTNLMKVIKEAEANSPGAKVYEVDLRLAEESPYFDLGLIRGEERFNIRSPIAKSDG